MIHSYHVLIWNCCGSFIYCKIQSHLRFILRYKLIASQIASDCMIQIINCKALIIWFGHVQKRPLEASMKGLDWVVYSPVKKDRGRQRTVEEIIKMDLMPNNIPENLVLFGSDGIVWSMQRTSYSEIRPLLWSWLGLYGTKC